MDVAIRSFVARFGRSKVSALGLVLSGVKEREANRSDVEKERLDTRRDRSGALGGSKITPPLFYRIRVRCRRKTIVSFTSVSKSTFIVYDHINTICAIIQRLFRQNEL